MSDDITYHDVNHEPITVGRVYWDNNLDLVRVTEIAVIPGRTGDGQPSMSESWHEPYVNPWHRTERLRDGRQSDCDSGKWGRLATYHPSTREDARNAKCILDMRNGPVDHQCSGAWMYLGLNRGGHETYACDSGNHYAIAAHTLSDHVCNPRACDHMAVSP